MRCLAAVSYRTVLHKFCFPPRLQTCHSLSFQQGGQISSLLLFLEIRTNSGVLIGTIAKRAAQKHRRGALRSRAEALDESLRAQRPQEILRNVLS